jgi:hypothetical protein
VAAWRREFLALTGDECADGQGGIDPKKLMSWQAAQGLPPDGKVRRPTLQAARSRRAAGPSESDATGPAATAEGPTESDTTGPAATAEGPLAGEDGERAGAAPDGAAGGPTVDRAAGGGGAAVGETSGTGAAAARDTVGEVTELLARGSISPEDAKRALDALDALSWSAEVAALSALDAKAVDSLIKALPPTAKADASYTKLICAMGPARALAYASELSTYGQWPWAEVEPPATAVGKVLAAIPAATRLQIAAHTGPILLHRTFDATADGEAGTLSKLLGLRFKVDVEADSDSGVDWDAAGLRRAWNVLESLPAVHLGGSNPSLAKLVRQQGTPGASAGGYYQAGENKASIAYDPAKLDAANRAADPGDPLYGVNRFDKVVRHEIGHSVDQQTGASAKYCIGNPDGGDWKEHGAGSGLAALMVKASNGAIEQWKDADQKKAIVDCLQNAIDNDSPLTLADLTALPFWAKLSKADQDSIKHDKVCTALQVHFAAQSPWYNSAIGFGIALADGRVYQESYEGDWTSYDASARARKVSQYQFRAPGEWFAEAYATYYEPNAGGHGALLAPVDPKTKQWLDKNIDGKISKV